MTDADFSFVLCSWKQFYLGLLQHLQFIFFSGEIVFFSDPCVLPKEDDIISINKNISFRRFSHCISVSVKLSSKKPEIILLQWHLFFVWLVSGLHLHKRKHDFVRKRRNLRQIPRKQFQIHLSAAVAVNKAVEWGEGDLTIWNFDEEAPATASKHWFYFLLFFFAYVFSNHFVRFVSFSSVFTFDCSFRIQVIFSLFLWDWVTIG